jgi:hypothetical protein
VVEAVAARYEDELEAETAAGYLRSVGIEARVRFDASMGLPRSTVPIRVITPFGDFQLLVAEGDLARAREALIPVGPPSLRPRRYRWLGWVLIAVMLGPLVLSWIVSLYSAR